MNTESMIAGRYFGSRRRQRFLPLLTFVSIGGVALGTMALVLVLSVMRGFGTELEKKFMGFNFHVTLTSTSGAPDISKEKIEHLLPKGSLVSEFVEGEAIAQTMSLGDIIAAGVKVRGIESEAPPLVKTLEFYFPEGSSRFAELNAPGSVKTLPGVILGDEILSQLNVHPDFEDRIDLVAPLADIGPTGEMEPRIRTYRLTGAFRSGVFEYDSKFALVSYEEARRLLGAQAVQGYHIMLSHPSDAPAVALSLRNALGESWRVESWDVQNKKLFAALKLERIAMASILILIILIASFSIVGVLMMVVSSKRKDIAILRSMGMNGRSIRKIFMLHGVLIGAIGSVIGGLAGSAVCIALWRWPIRLPASYYLDTLPVEWSLPWTVVFVASGILITLISSLYPISQATKDAPVVTLRYE